MGIKREIINLLDREDYKPIKKEDLAFIFEFQSKAEKRALYDVLSDMEKEGTIVKDSRGLYMLTEKSNLILGTISGHRRGFAFLIPDDKSMDDFFIPNIHLNTAMDGDRVLCERNTRFDVADSEEGIVVKILERKNSQIVGTLQMSGSFGFVIPDNQKISYDVFVSKDDVSGGRDGQKVVVDIVKWPTKKKSAEGRVVEVLGFPGEGKTDLFSIAKSHGIEIDFPMETIEEAYNIRQEITSEELQDRLDLRDLKTFTIDGKDAKDLDDAISIEKLDNGNFKLGVHIADVSHYAKEGSWIDKTANFRGNSVYLVDTVIPMLPEELSNGICSLNPGVDRLTLSVLMEIDKKGKVLSHEIKESVISSRRRLVYEHVSDYLEDGKKEESLEGLYEEMDLLKNLSEILYRDRVRKGAIDFDFKERKILVDENSKVKDIVVEERRIANRIIEECMLVTNETVAEEFYWTELPFLYRIHEDPDQEKIAEFNTIINRFGYILKGQENIHPKELQKLIEEVRGKKEEDLILNIMLRSLKQAKYSSEMLSHFGLASQYYTHFTAPIRRYADLTIHRIIKDYLNGRLDSHKIDSLTSSIDEIAEHVSKMERVAEEAERDVEDMKMAEFMVQNIGKSYRGTVSGLTNFGIFVELENTVEGLIKFEDMTDDFYNFFKEEYIVIGERHRRTFQIGDELDIVVKDSDPIAREIDFVLKEDR